jgi:hypothetical protein
LRKVGKFFKDTATDEFFHTVAEIALANSGDGSVDGDDERGKSGHPGAFNRGLSSAAATHQIELIEDGSGRGGFHIFQLVPRYGGKYVGGAGVAGGARCSHFAHGVHQAAVADGSEQTREGQIEADDADAEIAFVEGDGVAWAKEDVVEGAGVFAQRCFVVGSAIEVIENGAREAALGDAAKILNIHYAGRAESVGSKGHGKYITEKRPEDAMRNCREGAQAQGGRQVR